MREEYLLTGPLEKTNSAYALAKIAGIEMCHAYNTQFGTRYLCVMPTNLYGPGDNFDLESSHVLPGMIRKFHEGKVRGTPVVLWGTGSPRREFLHSDDMADACLYIMDRIGGAFKELFSADVPPLINIGCSQDMTIRELADLIREIVGYQGTAQWDASKPDGTPRKLLDTSLLTRLGWQPKIQLRQGIQDVYEWFKKSALTTSTRA
jgi:GDP-L-fucose synthase